MTVGTTACESMIAAGNVFLGLAEAPLVIRPYIKDLVTFIILCVAHQALHDIEWPFNPITTLTSAVFFIMEFNAQTGYGLPANCCKESLTFYLVTRLANTGLLTALIL